MLPAIYYTYDLSVCAAVCSADVQDADLLEPALPKAESDACYQISLHHTVYHIK